MGKRKDNFVILAVSDYSRIWVDIINSNLGNLCGYGCLFRRYLRISTDYIFIKLRIKTPNNSVLTVYYNMNVTTANYLYELIANYQINSSNETLSQISVFLASSDQRIDF